MQKENFKTHKQERKIIHNKTKKQLVQDAKVARKVENNITEIKLLNKPKNIIDIKEENTNENKH